MALPIIALQSITMYTSFFGLSEKPFAITPNPRYLYMSERHAEALAHLLYGMNEAGGFIQLTGEVGTGKTTIVRTLLEQIPPNTDVAVILNPLQNPIEFLLTLCQELGIFMRDEDIDSIRGLIDILNRFLLATHAKGRRTVLIIDEAQNLPTATLEQVRLLTNLETDTHKLLQIILIGQPELRSLLARNELRQLAQRITGRYHLSPLTRTETAAYVTHRLQVAGAQEMIFTPRALRHIQRCSRGIPRVINVICDRALLAAYTRSQRSVDAPLVRQAASEVFGQSKGSGHAKWLTAGCAGLLSIVALTWIVWQPTKPARKVASLTLTPPAATPAPMPPPAPTPEPMLPAVETLLHTHSADTGTDAAFQALVALWDDQVKLEAGTACTQIIPIGLQCVYQQGAWPQLRHMNRPAILSLIDDAGYEHHVTLSALTDTDAELVFATQKYTVTIADLTRYWNGNYLILWRPPLATQTLLAEGARGTAVRWLREQLDRITDNPLPTERADYFDATLAKAVATFQRTHQLHVDGIAGIQTQIILDALVNASSAPLLQSAGG